MFEGLRKNKGTTLQYSVYHATLQHEKVDKISAKDTNEQDNKKEGIHT